MRSHIGASEKINTELSLLLLLRAFVSVSQEFIAVRVQDPRVQNEGSWNSFVDYKIFLHVSINTEIKTHQVRFNIGL